jgi:hypothetical protein
MKFKVHMLAFMDGKIREVDVPDSQAHDKSPERPELLELVFWHGQNEVQPQELCSVSVGDVIELEGKFHMVVSLGFWAMSQEEFDAYKAMDRTSRLFYSLRRTNEQARD